ncbi:hypothetical protein Pmani_026529 [Petrolisthes manimaculis]|uniref:Uncharacterized protein n=1 Tax=Petrolisthes manimaculis TaxID=1843537 RepID=A0AAE1TWJ9_9EUCA|nr:hypothetical protein Pmani_026529 [Petrolisthes manimaculis]
MRKPVVKVTEWPMSEKQKSQKKNAGPQAEESVEFMNMSDYLHPKMSLRLSRVLINILFKASRTPPQHLLTKTQVQDLHNKAHLQILLIRCTLVGYGHVWMRWKEYIL